MVIASRANVIGISNKSTNPSMFEILELESTTTTIDIRNYNDLKKIIEKEKPDFIFHLAAQAIVSTALNDPLETISSNVMVLLIY